MLQALTTAGIWFAIVWLPLLLVLGAGRGGRSSGSVGGSASSGGGGRRGRAARRDESRSPAWHDAPVTDRRDTTGSRPDTSSGGRPSWRQRGRAPGSAGWRRRRRRRDRARRRRRDRQPLDRGACAAGPTCGSPRSMRRARWSRRSRRSSPSGRPTARDRFDGRVAFAAELPFDDAVVRRRDVVVRAPARAEPPGGPARDPPRAPPGGLFGHVTWLVDDRAFAPDRVFDRAARRVRLRERRRSQSQGRHPVRRARRRRTASCRVPRRGRRRARCWSTRSRSRATSRS